MSTPGAEQTIYIFLGVLCGVFCLLFLLWMCWACRGMSSDTGPYSFSMGTPFDGTPSKEDSDKLRKRILAQTNRRGWKKLRANVAPSQKPGDEACSICLESFAEGATSSVLAHLTVCQHYFHFECIWSWLVQNSSCPICRKQVQLSEKSIKTFIYDTTPSSGRIVYVGEADSGSPTEKIESENGENSSGNRWRRLWLSTSETRDLCRRGLRQLFWESVGINTDRPGATEPDVARRTGSPSHGESIFDWPMTPPGGYSTTSLPMII